MAKSLIYQAGTDNSAYNAKRLVESAPHYLYISCEDRGTLPESLYIGYDMPTKYYLLTLSLRLCYYRNILVK